MSVSNQNRVDGELVQQMSVFDVESLLAPIPAESPCGEDLEYDPAYIALEGLARGKPEQQLGDRIISAEEPDWRQIERASLDLLRRTADLRIVVHLARALLATVGFPGFADALSLMRGLLEERWDCVYPHLDSEEDNDPTMRVNAIEALAYEPKQGDQQTVLRAVRLAPLVASRTLGRFSLRDYQIASGEMTSLPNSGDPATVAGIDAAFLEVPIEELQANAEAVKRSIEMTVGIEAVVTEKVGAAQAPNLSALVQELRDADRILSDRLARRGAGTAAAATAAEQAGSNAQRPKTPMSAEITSREDVARMLDKACDYFRQFEPSSPVPLILERAKRLIAKDFVEILHDLAPEGVAQFEVVSGITRPHES
jgi:type VI secretion system protein ImpA